MNKYPVPDVLWNKIMEANLDNVDYPWSDIAPKEMFEIKKTDMKMSTLMTYISKKGIEFGKFFKVIDYNETSWMIVCIGERGKAPWEKSDKKKDVVKEQQKVEKKVGWGPNENQS